MTRLLKNIGKIFAKYTWWQWLLWIVGGLTVLSVFGAFFLAAGSEPSGKYSSVPIPPVTDPQFIASLSYGLHQQNGTGGTVIPLTNGDAFRTALFSAIDNARSSVNFTVYIWEKGEFSNQLIQKLVEKQKSGAEVRIILDDLGSKGISNKTFKELTDAGGKVETFRGLKFGQLTRYGHRNHRRAIIIDGQTGFTGGMAISDKWLGNAESPDHWRDEMYQLTGPLATALQGDFVDLWSGMTGEFLSGDKFYQSETSPTDNTRIKFIHFSQAPSPDIQILPELMVNSIQAAQHKLYIETPYLVPNSQLLKALLDRAHSGVDVELILPNNSNDSKLDRWASEYYYKQLLDAGVKIYEYQPTFNHTKFMVVDGQWSVIGSPNQNTRSRRLDEENGFGILDPKLGSEHEQIFHDDIARSKEITKQEWSKSSRYWTPLYWLATIFDKQI